MKIKLPPFEAGRRAESVTAALLPLQFGIFGSIIVEIMVREQDETEYLMSSPANRERLNKSMQEVEEGNIITFKTLEEARQSADKWAAEN